MGTIADREPAMLATEVDPQVHTMLDLRRAQNARLVGRRVRAALVCQMCVSDGGINTTATECWWDKDPSRYGKCTTASKSADAHGVREIISLSVGH